jgi:SOS-response transcriptional repressor LexA
MLYDKLDEIYDFIEEYQHLYDASPQYKQIALAVGISEYMVSRRVRRMQVLGMLKRKPGTGQAIALITRQPNWNALITPEPGEWLKG